MLDKNGKLMQKTGNLKNSRKIQRKLWTNMLKISSLVDEINTIIRHIFIQLLDTLPFRAQVRGRIYFTQRVALGWAMVDLQPLS
jgi:hypothetical protein